MRLYCITYQTPQRINSGGSIHKLWRGTQAECASERSALRKAKCTIISTSTVNVPTDKAGLIVFLNDRET